jgi:hypothetical protein
MIAQSAGQAGAFALAPGQAHELPFVVPLLARLPGVPVWVVADSGYSSHAFATAAVGEVLRTAPVRSAMVSEWAIHSNTPLRAKRTNQRSAVCQGGMSRGRCCQAQPVRSS